MRFRIVLFVIGVLSTLGVSIASAQEATKELAPQAQTDAVTKFIMAGLQFSRDHPRKEGNFSAQEQIQAKKLVDQFILERRDTENDRVFELREKEAVGKFLKRLTDATNPTSNVAFASNPVPPIITVPTTDEQMWEKASNSVVWQISYAKAPKYNPDLLSDKWIFVLAKNKKGEWAVERIVPIPMVAIR